MISINQHNVEIKRNMEIWSKKPLLRLIYESFYKKILEFINKNITGEVVEIGSGIGNFKSVFSKCITTDIFPNPWIDRVENAYKLSFSDSSVSNLVLFDVFHHLAFPGSALKELRRVLPKKGRVIIFEPCISFFSLFIYGIFHHEPIALFKKINWANDSNNFSDSNYYAAQGNATRIFRRNSSFNNQVLKDWRIIGNKKYSALSYVLSGGFSKPSLYPIKFLPFIKKIEIILNYIPLIFATRMMIVLEKK